ncbi:MAG: DUF951 domain-containing protein [Oscillospiraceae bacterium]|jgi:hypothetical protein|nr:DUF951 domain-containing protein [Oscillospiraceae bacterium]
MDIKVGDIITVKKPHPCGSKEFLVLRVGMDFRIKCTKCGHEIMIVRKNIERNIRNVRRNNVNV